MRPSFLSITIILSTVILACKRADDPKGSTSDQLLEENGFVLKAGFYSSFDNPEQAKELWDYLGRADIKISLSGHDGISYNGNHDITIKGLHQQLLEIKNKRIASIMLEKNHLDDALLAEVTKTLTDTNTQEIIVVGAHSSGIILESYTKNETKAANKSQ